MSLFSRRASSSADGPREVPRAAEVVLAAFARAHRGLFILDGPAIGTDFDRRGNELDVYCVFAPAQTPGAMNVARNALSSMTGVQISYHSSAEMAGSLMTFLSRRGKVIGERRKSKR